jgi:leader peptidase (prepilin peptidase)/N-methyltransferase
MLFAILAVLFAIPVAQLVAVASRAGIQDRTVDWTRALLLRRPRLLIPFVSAKWHRPSEIALVAGIPLLTALCFSIWPPGLALAYSAFLVLLAWASAVDLRSQLIPDESSIGGMFLGFVFAAAVPALHLHTPSELPFFILAMKGFVHGVTGALLGSGLVVTFALVCEFILRKEAMGFGDVKLAGAIGAFLGWKGAFFSLFGGAAVGVLGLLVFGVARKCLRRDNGPLLPREPLPFGPLLALGAVLYLFGFDRVTENFFGTIQQLAN